MIKEGQSELVGVERDKFTLTVFCFKVLQRDRPGWKALEPEVTGITFSLSGFQSREKQQKWGRTGWAEFSPD